MGDTSYPKGGGGATLPDTPANALLDAGNAGKLVSLASGTGAGETVSYIDAFQVGAVAAIGAEVAGTALISTGAGVDVTSPDISAFLASANAAAALASIGGGAGPVVLYASDCTAEAGSESASITGTGSSSTFTLTASSTARTYGTAGATAARIVCPIPAGARVIEVEVGPISAVSGMATGGYRYLTIAHREAISGGAPTSLWGASWNDATTLYYGSLLGGGNSGARAGAPQHMPTATDRWLRAVLNPREPNLAFATGAGSSGARPTTWGPISTPNTGIYTPYGSYGIADTDAVTAIAIVLQSFGSVSASSITAGLRITVAL